CGAQAQDLAGIVRREVAAAGRFQARPLDPAGRPGDAGPDRITIACGPDQANAKPVLALSCLVAQQQRRPAVVGDQDVWAAIVVVIAQGGSSRGKLAREGGPGLRRDVVKFPVLLAEELL